MKGITYRVCTWENHDGTWCVVLNKTAKAMNRRGLKFNKTLGFAEVPGKFARRIDARRAGVARRKELQP